MDEATRDGECRPGGDAGAAAERLVALMDRLRAECPWDRKQGWDELAGYLLEETHETLEALRARDLPALEGELGDLLFQIVFLARLGREAGAFDLASVARRIEAKLVSRHPHVFGDAVVTDAGAVKSQWEDLKAEERRASGTDTSPLASVPRSLPALLRAYRVTARAADAGFDWERDADVLAKLDEEVAEFKAEVLREGAPKERVAHEIGDVLFTVVNVARRLGVDPEQALQGTNDRFARRFGAIHERLAAEGRAIRGTPLAELDRLWEDAKRTTG